MSQTAGYWVDRLINLVQAANEASGELQTLGVRVALSVNGPNYGDRVSLRLEADDLAARAPLTNTLDGGE